MCAAVFISSSVNQLDWWPTHLSTHPYIVHACEHSLCMPTKWVDGAFYMGCKHWESIVPFMHETHKITWFSFPGKIMVNYIVQFIAHSYAVFVCSRQYFSIIFLYCINVWNPNFLPHVSVVGCALSYNVKILPEWVSNMLLQAKSNISFFGGVQKKSKTGLFYRLHWSTAWWIGTMSTLFINHF